MARWERVTVPPDFAGTTRAERQGGSYLRYHPDLLTQASNSLSPQVLEYAADVTTALVRLGARLSANPLPVLYSTALRSESISSSWIEGIKATPRDIAVAQLGESDVSHSAGQVVRNIAAMKDAIQVLGSGPWEHEHLWAIQHELLPWHREGYREDQVWVGGTHKLNAQYAAPPGSLVSSLMDDLLEYANTSGDLPVVLAAILHAQFETIHPFEDGNGRVGRSLVHGVLKRARLIDGGVVPLSTALRNDPSGHIAALTAYRYDGTDEQSRSLALSEYVNRFLGYLEAAIASAENFADAASALHARWRTAVAGVRVDGALHRALDVVVENPVVTATFLAAQVGVSTRRAQLLVKQLEQAQILAPTSGKYRKAPLYQADDVLKLLSFGAEAGPHTPPPRPVSEQHDPTSNVTTLVHRCTAPTATGPCQNRVPREGDRCWRHPTAPV